MKIITHILFVFFALNVLYIGFLNLSAEYYARSARVTREGLRHGQPTQKERKNLIDAYRLAAEASLSHIDTRSDYVRLLIRESELADSEELFLCEALRYLETELEAEPKVGRLLTLRAAVYSRLSSGSCNGVETHVDALSLIGEAVELNPHDPETLLEAALIARRVGNATKSRAYLRRFLNTGALHSPQEREFVLSQLQDLQSFKAIIPARFPQLSYWMGQVEQFRPEVYAGLQEGASELLSEALSEAEDKSSRGDLDESVFLEYLQLLDRLQPSTQLRARVDELLARMLGRLGRGTLSEYFRLRSQFEELSLVVGQRVADNFPEKKPLYDWNSKKPVFLDDYYQSIGFYLGAKQLASLIEIRLSKSEAKVSINLFQLFVSDDNLRWAEFPEPFKRRSFAFDGKDYFVFELPARGFRYWKLHVPKAERAKLVGGDLTSMLRVFGNAASEKAGEVEE